jgi:hypothetical protein
MVEPGEVRDDVLEQALERAFCTDALIGRRPAEGGAHRLGHRAADRRHRPVGRRLDESVDGLVAEATHHVGRKGERIRRYRSRPILARARTLS